MNPAARKVPVRKIGLPEPSDGSDQVAVEEPFEIRLRWVEREEVRSRSLAVTMRTPGHDPDLAAGFLFTEGIIRNADDIGCISEPSDNIILVELRAGTVLDESRLQRNFYATSSCGVCGKASLEALKAQSPYPLHNNEYRFDASSLSTLPDRLADRQTVFSETGGLHASATFDQSGGILEVREDVGRHNTVDKLVGTALREGQLPLARAGLLVSGRAGFEIVQKALMAGCPLVAAFGAPSSLAVDLAWEFDMSLVGFLRDGRFNIYAGPGRVS